MSGISGGGTSIQLSGAPSICHMITSPMSVFPNIQMHGQKEMTVNKLNVMSNQLLRQCPTQSVQQSHFPSYMHNSVTPYPSDYNLPQQKPVMCAMTNTIPTYITKEIMSSCITVKVAKDTSIAQSDNPIKPAVTNHDMVVSAPTTVGFVPRQAPLCPIASHHNSQNFIAGHNTVGHRSSSCEPSDNFFHP